MTGILIALFIAIGLGCAYLRLSALAVGLIVLIVAAVGIFVGLPSGWGTAALMALVPMLLIECTYFLGMLVIARVTEKASNPSLRI
jgi:hypothetical protein